MSLTDAQCRNAAPRERDYKLSDGGGLYLFVRKTGSRLWRMAYRFDGKQKTLAFGAYPTVTITEARRKRDAAKGHLARGEDPFEGKSREQVETFKMVAAEWFQAREQTWSQAHSTRLWACLNRDLFPVFGSRPVAAVTRSEIHEALKKIDERGARETAHRARNYVSQILRYAIATERCQHDVAHDLRGALPPVKKSRNLARLKAEEMGDFFAKLACYDGEETTTLALELIVFTFVRTKELRFATWSEVDRKNKLWRIPGERMKMSLDHVVPLTPAVLSILDRLEAFRDDSDFIVPGEKDNAPISSNTLIYALYRMGYHRRATVHGFRGLASTVLNESGLFQRDWIEKQLAHEEGNRVRAAYNAAEYITHRREMMQWWSDWLDEKKSIGVLLS